MRSLICFTILVSSLLSFSQGKLEYKTNLELGAGVHLLSADACSGCSTVSSSFSLSSRFYVAKKIFFRPELNYNRFLSSGQGEQHIKFMNNSYGLHLNLAYGFHNIRPSSFSKREKTEFFLSGLAGVLHHNPFVKIDENKVFLQVHEVQGVTYSKFTPVVGAGLNFNFKLPQLGRLGARLELVYTFTDYLDNVANEPFLNEINLGENKTYSFNTENFDLNDSNDFYVRFQLTYEVLFRTKHDEKSSF